MNTNVPSHMIQVEPTNIRSHVTIRNILRSPTKVLKLYAPECKPYMKRNSEYRYVLNKEDADVTQNLRNSYDKEYLNEHVSSPKYTNSCWINSSVSLWENSDNKARMNESYYERKRCVKQSLCETPCINKHVSIDKRKLCKQRMDEIVFNRLDRRSKDNLPCEKKSDHAKKQTTRKK